MFSLATSLASSPQLFFNQTLIEYKNGSRLSVSPDPGANATLFENTTTMLESSSSLLETSTMEIFEDSTLVPTNNSFTEYAEIPYYIKATSMTFCVVIMCLGVIGNVMVPIVILKTKDMRNSTNIFLVNLSVADLMVLLVCTPTVLVEVNSKPETWVLGKELCLAVPFVELTVAHASVLTILAISFERYYAICEPLRAGYVCTKARAALICALAWVFAAVFTSPILAIAEHRTVDRGDGGPAAQCLTQASTFWQTFFFVMVILLLYILPLIILVVLYSIIARNLIQAASKVVMNKTLDPYNVRARKQVILMLGTVVLCFFLCLMPYRVLALWIIVTPSEVIEDMNPEKWYNLLYFSRIMLYINSAINPILYNLMSSKFRLGFCKVCFCYRRTKDGVKNAGVRQRTTVTGSTSSSLTRTTNSLKKFFHRNSLENKTHNEDNEDKANERVERSNLFRFVKNGFVRQQSDPSETIRAIKVKRMRSDGDVFEISAMVDNKTEVDVRDAAAKHSEGMEEVQDRPRRSLRRAVFVNTKAKSLECEKTKYQKFSIDSVIICEKSKGCAMPESYV